MRTKVSIRIYPPAVLNVRMTPTRQLARRIIEKTCDMGNGWRESIFAESTSKPRNVTAKPRAPLNDSNRAERSVFYSFGLVTLDMTIREGSRPEAGRTGRHRFGAVPAFHRCFERYPPGSPVISASKMLAQMIPCPHHAAVDRALRHGSSPRRD